MFGFPRDAINLLRCTKDGGQLELDSSAEISSDGRFISNGELACSQCDARYTIVAGIADLIGTTQPQGESAVEQQLRDSAARAKRASLGLSGWDDEDTAMEMQAMLTELPTRPDQAILELGCGDGRFTPALARRCRRLIAVDFSVECLRHLQERLQAAGGTTPVALVLGDVTTLKVREASFDVVFSTLVSNLPTVSHRDLMFRLAQSALKDDGRLVFSTHHHGWRQRLAKEEKSGRYSSAGIYRYNFSVDECIAEVRPHFESMAARTIQIHFPLARTLRLPVVTLSKLSEHIWPIRNLGMLVLCKAETPVRRALQVLTAGWACDLEPLLPFLV